MPSKCSGCLPLATRRTVNFVVLDDRELLQEEGGELLADRFVHTHPMIGIDNSSVKRAIGPRTAAPEHHCIRCGAMTRNGVLPPSCTF